MKRTEIARIFADHGTTAADRSVTVCGWVRTIRDMKTFGFIELNDGSCFKNLQVVMDADTLENYKEIAKQNVGAALIVTGHRGAHPRGQAALGAEGRLPSQVEGTSAPDYPLQKKRHSVEFLRTIQHLRPRTNLFSAAFRVRSRGGLRHPLVLPGAGALSMSTPPSSPPPTARAPARCSG